MLTRLVGDQQLDPAPGDHSLYTRVFGRGSAECGSATGILRYVGYEVRQRPGAAVRFLGAEIDDPQRIPDGMLGWEFTGSHWTIRRNRNGRSTPVWRETIHWLWRNAPRSAPFCGEFRAQGPHDWNSHGTARDVSMVANAYFATDGRAPKDNVQLAEYDPRWPIGYAAMADWLRGELGPEVALRLEHYGSTAIPGMPAKPVIDILVDVPSFQAAKQLAIPLLNNPLWEYWWYSDHMIFIRRNEFLGRRTHHIHMAPRDHTVWKGLAFRDHLRTHPADARRYADLKCKLASAHSRDREAYTDAKRAFVNEITSSALDLTS